MASSISQRELRNDSGDILRRVDQGETFVVTRNGAPVADLSLGTARDRVGEGRLHRRVAPGPAQRVGRQVPHQGHQDAQTADDHVGALARQPGVVDALGERFGGERAEHVEDLDRHGRELGGLVARCIRGGHGQHLAERLAVHLRVLAHLHLGEVEAEGPHGAAQTAARAGAAAGPAARRQTPQRAAGADRERTARRDRAPPAPA